MLPPRIPKPAKRSSRWRSSTHLKFVRSHACCVAGCNGRPIQAAHVRYGSHTGMGQKPDDWRTVSLCKHHHDMQHTMSEPSFWEDYAQRDVEKLIDAFCKASPKAREIMETRNV